MSGLEASHLTPKDKEDNGGKAMRERGRKRKIKQRHKFTKEELNILEQLFKQSPYLDFSSKMKIAKWFHCPVYVIDNWFQNKRARLPPELRRKISARRRMPQNQDFMLTGHPGTQVQALNYTTGQVSYTPGASVRAVHVEMQNASDEEHSSCDLVIQNIRMRSNGAVEYQVESGSPFNFRPMNFTPFLMSEQYYKDDWPETWESQCCFTSSVVGCVPSVQGQGQMDGNYSSLFAGQQQGHWGDQQQRQDFADWLDVHQSQGDSGQWVPSFFLSEHQGQSAPSNAPPVPDGQQGPSNSFQQEWCRPVNTHLGWGLPEEQPEMHKLQGFREQCGAKVQSRRLRSLQKTLGLNQDPEFPWMVSEKESL